MSGRPLQFEINTGHQLAQGSVFLGLGRHFGSTYFHDSSLYCNHGELTNMDAATGWVWSSELGRWVMDFDGSNDRVTVPDSASLSPTGSFALACWVYPTSVAGVRGVLSKYGSDAAAVAAYRLAFNGDKIRCQIGDGGTTTNMTFDSNSVLAANAWQHIAWIHDAPGDTNTLFCNGQSAGGAYVKGDGTFDPPDTAQAFRIGGTPSVSQFFIGQIADPVVCGQLLSSAIITQLADRADATLSGLILAPRPRVFASTAAPPAPIRHRLSASPASADTWFISP